MKISPINNNTQHFKAKVQPNEAIDNAYEMIEKCVNTETFKDLNYAKDFLDSMRRIIETDKVETFKISIDKKRNNYTYTKINGRRMFGGANESQQNLREDYLIVEGCKKFSKKLNNNENPTPLDKIKTEIEETIEKLSLLKEKYSKALKRELIKQKLIIEQDAKK